MRDENLDGIIFGMLLLCIMLLGLAMVFASMPLPTKSAGSGEKLLRPPARPWKRALDGVDVWWVVLNVSVCLGAVDKFGLVRGFGLAAAFALLVRRPWFGRD